MRFVSLISELESSTEAVTQLVDEARKGTGGKIDVVFAFLTGHHRENADDIVEKLWLELDPRAVIGCTAEGIIGANRELEKGPGLALLAGDMPGAGLHPFHIRAADWEDLLQEPESLAERMGYGPATQAIIGLGDPFSTPLPALLNCMNQTMAGIPLVGGMASAGRYPGSNALLKNDATFDDGMVGLSLSGKVTVQTVVSQGCRPIGRTLVITKSHDNEIEQLGGRPALAALTDMVGELSESERLLIRENGLLIGRVISEYQEQFGRGDFLIRGLAGANQNTGSIQVGDFVRTGQTVQFHVHDAVAAHEDLQCMLDAKRVGEAPPAALLFSCNGRGTRLFPEPGHDAGQAHCAMPGTAVAGFFAAGEIGPVGGKNFMHGHTASFALLRPKE